MNNDASRRLMTYTLASNRKVVKRYPRLLMGPLSISMQVEIQVPWSSTLLFISTAVVALKIAAGRWEQGGS
eukprot:2421739-Karenia_brevis.AAC.1